jgi:hypothetical protein
MARSFSDRSAKCAQATLLENPSVPVVPVDEHCDLGFGKNDIGVTRKAANVLAESQPKPVKFGAKLDLSAIFC